MFLLYPLLGLGQGQFYRQSADYELTSSHFLSIDQNGENAHNYFLQTLAETGLVGISFFILLIIYPILRIENKRSLIPGVTGLVAIFLGNVFAHSMLIRENLAIAVSFVALMYAWVGAEEKVTSKNKNFQPLNFPIYCCFKQKIISIITLNRIFIALTVLLVLLMINEVYRSYQSKPFIKDVQCFKARPLDQDGWTSGIYKVSIPAGAKGVTLNIKGTQPDALKRPLSAIISIIHGEKSLIEQFTMDFSENNSKKILVNFPNGAVADDGEYRVEVQLTRCFIPRNMGINADGRRLGIQIESSIFNY